MPMVEPKRNLMTRLADVRKQMLGGVFRVVFGTIVLLTSFNSGPGGLYSFWLWKVASVGLIVTGVVRIHGAFAATPLNPDDDDPEERL